jgi:class 3 adenylate cyclase
MKQPVERKLAAILAADVAGYSRLMGADEEGTHERLKAHLARLVDPKIKEHRGRIIKNTGDGLLAEFASVVAMLLRSPRWETLRHTVNEHGATGRALILG